MVGSIISREASTRIYVPEKKTTMVGLKQFHVTYAHAYIIEKITGRSNKIGKPILLKSLITSQ
jgi:hypothetical protein